MKPIILHGQLNKLFHSCSPVLGPCNNSFIFSHLFFIFHLSIFKNVDKKTPHFKLWSLLFYYNYLPTCPIADWWSDETTFFYLKLYFSYSKVAARTKSFLYVFRFSHFNFSTIGDDFNGNHFLDNE